MTKNQFVEKYKNSYVGDNAAIVLEVHMPTNETEIIINPNVPDKVDYIMNTYDDDLKHRNNSNIYIKNVNFVDYTPLSNYLKM